MLALRTPLVYDIVYKTALGIDLGTTAAGEPLFTNRLFTRLKPEGVEKCRSI